MKTKVDLNESEYLPEIEIKCKICNKVFKSYHIRDLTDNEGKTICCQGNTSTYSLMWVHVDKTEQVLIK